MRIIEVKFEKNDEKNEKIIKTGFLFLANTTSRVARTTATHPTTHLLQFPLPPIGETDLRF